MTEPEGVAAHDEPTGERFIPEVMGGDLIDAEHQARYRLALPYVRGKKVLDAGCGVGWGSVLLIEAGATQVVGLDIAEDAERDFRRRLPDTPFVRGDLATLPFGDDTFDVIVCFEALEHTDATGAALDGMARILRPDGALFVSSPNPDVYPAGNPFHLHELTPDELVREVGARFPNLTMMRQYLLLGSMICTEAEAATMPRDLAGTSRVITALGAGHDPYAVAVAGGGAPAELPGIQTMVTSHQLTNLATLSAAVDEERAHIHRGYNDLVAERDRLMAELAERAEQAEQLTAAVESAHAQLREADGALRRLTAERDDLVARLVAAPVEPSEPGDAGEQDSVLAIAEPDSIDSDEPCPDCARLRRDRDEFAAALVRAEQDLATATTRAESAASAHVRPVPPRSFENRP